MNKFEIIRNEFLENKEINVHDAFFICGTHRLAAIVHQLQDIGYLFERTVKQVENPITKTYESIWHYRLITPQMEKRDILGVLEGKLKYALRNSRLLPSREAEIKKIQQELFEDSLGND